MRVIYVNNSEKGDLIRKVVLGDVTLHQIDAMAPDVNEAVEIRRSAIEKLVEARLEHIGSAHMDYGSIKGKNAENIIGMAAIPLGVVGPIKVNGGHFKGAAYVPLATTEGALIASIGRGVKAINLSGGATVRVINDGMTRGPVFTFNSVVDAERFSNEWLPENLERLKAAAGATTKHGVLQSLKPIVRGNNVFVRFSYKTGDAMGMNMVTVATEAACAYIEAHFPTARLVAVSGNFCSDKKQSSVNALEGRGKTVVAEAVINAEVLRDVLKTTAEQVHDVNYKKNWIGSATAGSLTQFNAHFANSIAAIFLATGQDAAQVIESSSGYTITEVRGKDLYISVTLPTLEIGTIGGGTGLPTQREALSIIGVAGAGDPSGNNALKFAEIIAAIVVSGELNLLSALATRELGKAHQELGRNRPGA